MEGIWGTILASRRNSLRKLQVRHLLIEFFIACIIRSLEYLAECKIIHRDIKPENLVIDNKGILRLTDFGIARLHRSNNGKDTSGTPGYMGKIITFKFN